MENTFDKVLKDKLGEVSVAPSPHVWQNIAEKLEQRQQKKRTMYPWLGLAASVLLISLGAWWFFSLNEAQVKLGALVKVQKKPTGSSEVQLGSEENLLAKEGEHLVSVKAKLKAPLAQNVVVLANAPVTIVEPKTTAIVLQEEQIANLTEVPPIEPSTVRSGPEEITSAAAEPSATKRSKKRIRSLSDLVNFVVATVDTREDKIVETSSDEGGLSLISLNVGPVKIKKINTDK
ncbi:MAG: hypothetical protein ACKOWL_07390 [Sphingobacteriaceae bacterium]